MKRPSDILALAAHGVSGCGAAPNSGCNLVPSLFVSPATATVSSSAATPGNQTQFTFALGETADPPGGN